MIKVSSQQQLALLFPHSNKVISKILEAASPEQLKELSQAKDLKAVLYQLMTDTLDPSKSNKIILDVLKNSEVFKDLGSFPKEMKALIELLSKEQNPSKELQKLILTLKQSLLEVQTTKADVLKNFVKDSGVFLESKFLEQANPKEELKTSLITLKDLLQASKIKPVQTLISEVKTLIKHELLVLKQDESPSIKALKPQIDTLVNSLKDIIKKADPLYSKTAQDLVSKLELLNKAPILDNVKSLKPVILISSIKNTIAELSAELRTSSKANTKALVGKLELIQTKIQNLPVSPTTALLKDLSTHLQELITKDTKSMPLSKSDAKTIKDFDTEVKTLSKMKPESFEVLKLDELKFFFSQVTSKLDAISPSSSKSIFDLIEKILSSLKQPSQNFSEQKIDKNIKSFLLDFKQELSKADVVYTKPLLQLIDKLSVLAKPSHILENKLLQDNLQKDIKALLLGMEKEVAGLPTANEITKLSDKLLLQIDYFQLLSHLSHTSYLYLPYSWEGLENGKFAFKKNQDGSCYCEIDLQLKEYGQLNIMLQLFQGNQINMTIYTQDHGLQEIFEENISELRKALNMAHLNPRSIKISRLSEKDSHPYGSGEKLKELGFEVKG